MTVTSLPCPCGGTLRPWKFDGEEYDASGLLGIPVVLRGEFVGNRCDRCDQRTVPGALLQHAAEHATLLLLKLDRRLSGAEARFLRKSALALSTDELARLLLVDRGQIRAWEVATSLSEREDAALRDLVLGLLLPRYRLGDPARHGRLARIAARTRRAVRRRPAPPRPPALRFSSPAAV